MTLCTYVQGVFLWRVLQVRIVKLSRKYADTYGKLPETMHKSERPYYCLEIKVESRTFAIPLRHHIRHKYCFHTLGEAGIDYSKAIPILDASMVSDEPARIDTAEWNILRKNEDEIFIGFNKYLRLYRKAVSMKHIPRYKSIVSMSALQYFEI